VLGRNFKKFKRTRNATRTKESAKKKSRGAWEGFCRHQIKIQPPRLPSGLSPIYDSYMFNFIDTIYGFNEPYRRGPRTKKKKKGNEEIGRFTLRFGWAGNVSNISVSPREDRPMMGVARFF